LRSGPVILVLFYEKQKTPQSLAGLMFMNF